MSTIGQQVEGFLTSIQQNRLWLLQNTVSPQPFRIRLSIEIVGRPDRARLTRALTQTIARHEILRTRFVTMAGMKTPLQSVTDPAAVELAEIDPGAASDPSRGLPDRIRSGLDQDLDFESGSPLKAGLAQLGEDRHLLVLEAPSMCADAASARLLFDDLVGFYQTDDSSDSLQEETLQYSQYGDWLQELLEGEYGQAAKDFWNERQGWQGRGAELPLSRPAEADDSAFEVESLSLDPTPGTLSHLAARGEELGVSAAALLLTAWQASLLRLSGAEEVWAGAVFDGRKYAELETLPGLVDTAAPIALSPRPGMTFSDAVRQCEADLQDASEALEAFAFDSPQQYFPFLFEMVRLPQPIESGGVRFSLDSLNSCSERFDLRLTVLEQGDDLRLDIHFNPHLVQRPAADRLRTAFRMLLDSALADPTRTIEELEVLNSSARRRLLDEFNSTQGEPAALPAQAQFERTVDSKPQAVAVERGDQSLSYRQLEERANRIAHFLGSRGLTTESATALFLKHSLDLPAAALGVLKSGGAYVPIDPASPRERIGYVLEDSGAQLLITEQSLLEFLPTGLRTPVLCLDSQSDEIDGLPAERPDIPVDWDNLAYIIYTSGSTGRPKGTLVTHRGLSNYLAWAAEAYETSRGVGAPLHSSVGFDLSVTSLFAPLLAGGKVALSQSDDSLAALSESLRSGSRFSFVKATPAQARLLAGQLTAEQARDCTRYLVLGGEALTASDLEFWRKNAPDTVLVNEYGPTEAVVGCCTYRSALGDLPEQGAIPIGGPISNVRLYVLDAQLNPVPEARAGELYIGGAGLCRGYLGRPGLTARSFVPSPFSNSQETGGERLYRTGDLVRHLPEGGLEYLGRIDDQVKIKGYRVELGEIETRLAAHPDLREAAAALRQDGSGNALLAGYVVPREGRPAPGPERLREFLFPHLPEYMIPTAWAALDSLPLAASGKVDRKSLPSPEKEAARASAPYAAPRSAQEEVLAAIFRQVLDRERVGIDDRYFDIGGDSIRSIQIIARAQQRGLDFTIDQLFEHQTIRELAAFLERCEASQKSLSKTEPFCLISEQDRRKLADDAVDAYPLSMTQAGMVYHRERHPESAVYHDVFGYHIETPLDLELLQKAVDQMVERHPMLRTSFDLGGFSQPLQVVHREGRCPIGVDDLSDLAEADQQAALGSFMEAEKKRDFDYGDPPLLRFHVHVLSGERFQFWVSFHHAILDGWSDFSMLVELFIGYIHLLRGQEPPLQPPAALYRDFIAMERQAAESEEERRFWAEYLDGVTPLRLPRLKAAAPAADGVTQDGDKIERPLADETASGLHDLAQSAAVPLKNVLMTAHLKVMSLISDQPYGLTYVVSVGRPESQDGDKVLGLHLNSMPFKLDMQAASWLDLAQACFETERELLAHRRFPSFEIRQLMNGQRASEALFYFTHYYNVLELDRYPEAKILGWRGFEESSNTFSAHFTIDPFTGRILLNLYYDRSQLTQEQIEQMADWYLQALESMASDPTAGHLEFRPLDEKDRSRLLAWGSGQPLEQGGESAAAVHQLFEARRQRQPDAEAVIWDEGSMTYRQLDELANGAAQRLIGQGIGAESVVGLCMQRSPRLLASMLGVLKAGAAYLPLDPRHPRERLAYQLSDSGSTLVIADAAAADGLPAGLRILDPEEFAPEPDSPQLAIRSENAAYVIYTSGSTGRPKGVTVPHRALVNHSLDLRQRYSLAAGDRVLQYAAVGFDVAAEEIFPTLAAGAACALWPGDASGSALEFLETVERHSVSVVNLPSPAWHELTALMQDSDEDLPACLRQVIVGSDTVSPERFSQWREDRRSASIGWTNCYGLTEAAITSTAYEPNEAEGASPLSSVPIGRPLSNVRVYAVGGDLELKPAGLAGELCIAGQGLARGYLNQPGLTAQRFLPDPFSTTGGERMYRTGDSARFLDDGNLEFLGRIDQQVKIRGVRIEPGEIESALSQHPGIAQAAVVDRREGPSETRLVAYVVPETGSFNGDSGALHSRLRRYLGERLPEAMIPSAFVEIESMPLNSNGKVDRKALPEPDFARPQLDVDYQAPSTPAEEVLCEMWAELLGVERVGLRDHFFELGGHSLKATQLIARLRDVFQIELRLSALYDNPTVESLLEAIAQAAQGRERVEEIAELVQEVSRLSEEEVQEELRR